MFHSYYFFFFLNSFLLIFDFLLFTLTCIISSYLSAIITEGVCYIDFFRFGLVVCFSGQMRTIFFRPEKQNLCDRFFANCYVGMRWAIKFTLMMRKQICVEFVAKMIYTFGLYPLCQDVLISRKDSLLSDIFAIADQKFLFQSFFSFKPSFAFVFFSFALLLYMKIINNLQYIEK